MEEQNADIGTDDIFTQLGLTTDEPGDTTRTTDEPDLDITEEQDIAPALTPSPEPDEPTEEPVEEEEEEEEEPTAPAAPAAPKARDFTGVDDNVAKLLKKMGNDAYEYFYPLARQIKEGKLLAADSVKSFADHEDSYLLSPEYKEVQKKLASSYQTLSWLQQQAARAQTEKRFAAYVPGSGGQAVLQEFEATPENLRQLDRAIAKAETQYETLGQEIPRIKENHSKEFSSWREQMTSLEKQVFGEKIPPQMEPYIKGAEQLFPRSAFSHPSTNIAVKAIALLTAFKNAQAQIGVKAKPATVAKGKRPKAHAGAESADKVDKELAELDALLNG